MIAPLSRLLSLLCVVCLANAGRAESRPAPIRDDAGLFHADAIAHAEQGVADIRRTFDRNLFVRTVASATPQPRRWFPYLRTPQVNRMLEQQARKYADESGLPGIYVVICNRPRDVHVIVRPKDDTDFTRHDAERLRRMLAHDIGSDAVLAALVDQVRATLQDHATHGSSSVVNDVVLVGLLGGGFVMWLLLGVLRMKMRDAGVSRSGEPSRTSEAALLGAMFGCPAALCIYDKLYPCMPGVCEPQAEIASEENSARTDGEDHPVPESAEDAAVSP